GSNVADLCLVFNAMIPPKFKVLEFDKYRGNTCLRNHLTMYFRNMSCWGSLKLVHESGARTSTCMERLGGSFLKVVKLQHGHGAR
ncbi:hypothetical protein CR513_50295, partial [Mucuna pruriens]